IAQELEKTREFKNLKLKYKAHQYEDSSPKSHLYKILKNLEREHKLREQDINFLKKRKLTDTIQIANEQYISLLKSKIHLEELPNDLEIEWLKNNGREDIIVLAQQKHYAILKRKYGLIEPNLPMHPFYEIMLKLEKKERLDIVLVTQLIEQNMLSREGKIATAHSRLEAEFYEQEIMRTGNNWNIPNASSYWRKANEPEQALRVTELDLNKVKENKLKSAILVTRGGAFRDMNNLDEAEKCAKKAIDFHSDSYQPYTLLGAIYYDRFEYSKGDYYFDEAIKRGAKPGDIDDEIKRIFRSIKDEENRHKAAIYLLNKDPNRYEWAKCYLKKIKAKK
ncbi:tetratricopeptide repeat protein, partial [Nostoc piscinale]